MLAANGAIYGFGSSATVREINPGSQRAVALGAAADGGHWVLLADGRVLAVDGAETHGDVVLSESSARPIDLCATPSDSGYWVLDHAGGVFSFGDAAFFGSIPGLGLAHPVDTVAMQSTTTGNGYWLIDRAGGVYAFGDAGYFGSAPERDEVLEAGAVDIVGDGEGYALLDGVGGIHRFGPGASASAAVRPHDLAIHGIALVRSAWGGLLVIDRTGAVYPYGRAAFLGSAAQFAPSSPIVDAIASPVSAVAGMAV
jgi:hypothetical protein